MKRILVACMIVGLAGASAFADDLAGRLGIGGSLAAGIPVGSKWATDRNDTGLGLGGWLAYGLNRRWSARLGYGNLRFSRGPARMEDITLGAAYALAPESLRNPSVKAGVGPSFPRSVPDGRPTVLGLTAGLGVDRFLTQCFSLGATLDWLYSARAGSARHEVHALQAGLTAGVWFGGRAAPKQAKVQPTPAPAPVVAAPVIGITLTPSAVALGPGASQAFTASVSGTPNQAVTWSLQPELGAITASGVYTAPTVIAAAQKVAATAASQADPSKTAAAQITLQAPEKVEISLAVQFDTAKDVVKPEYDNELQKVAGFLKSYPSAQAQIEGHTDNVGNADYNRALSQRRADAVRKALIDRFGADGGRLTAKGFGPDRPIADNSTPEGRSRNRRVVATFTAIK